MLSASQAIISDTALSGLTLHGRVLDVGGGTRKSS
jgi:hypothetical protein